HQQHAHLRPLLLWVENLEVQLNAFHVEGDVLLGFPVEDLPRVRLRQAIHPNLLDDHVPTAHRSGDPARLHPEGLDHFLDGVHHRPRVHDLSLDDRVGSERKGRQAHQPRLVTAMVHGDGLDEATAHVESDRLLRSLKETHRRFTWSELHPGPYAPLSRPVMPRCRCQVVSAPIRALSNRPSLSAYRTTSYHP